MKPKIPTTKVLVALATLSLSLAVTKPALATEGSNDAKAPAPASVPSRAPSPAPPRTTSTPAAPAAAPSAASPPNGTNAQNATPTPSATSASSDSSTTEAATALDRVRAAYEYGDMEMVVDSARLVAEGRLRPTPAQRVQALRFLGIGLFLTGRTEGAETAFFDLLRLKPGAKLDPTQARPDVVAFFETVRARHAEEIRQAASNRTGKRLLLAFLPPIGQFQNGDRGRGLVLAALELVSAGVAIGTYAQLKSWEHVADRTFPGHTDDAHTLRIINYVSIGTLIVAIGAGIIDGVVNLNRSEEEPPLAWLSPSHGLGLRF